MDSFVLDAFREFAITTLDAESEAAVADLYQDIGLSLEDCRSKRIDEGVRPTILFNPDLNVLCYDSLRSTREEISQAARNSLHLREGGLLGAMVIYPALVGKVQASPYVFLNPFWDLNHMHFETFSPD
ncbi:hypothetical protein NHQ30_009619 [Ciborinia camelliae]|nr:hypothetical protein NHQ30_009619 [Ciborinia camelliae]